jgi:hypothetical protein
MPSHLVALLALGVDPKLAHFVRRPAYFAVFGWRDEDVPRLTGTEEARLAEVEDLTDRLVLPAFSAVDPQAADHLVTTLPLLLDVLQADGRALGDDQGSHQW